MDPESFRVMMDAEWSDSETAVPHEAANTLNNRNQVMKTNNINAATKSAINNKPPAPVQGGQQSRNFRK